MKQSLSELKRIFMDMENEDNDLVIEFKNSENDPPPDMIDRLETISYQDFEEERVQDEVVIAFPEQIQIDDPIFSVMAVVGITHYRLVEPKFYSIDEIDLDKIPMIGWKIDGRPIKQLVIPLVKYGYVLRTEIDKWGVHSSACQHPGNTLPVFAVSEIRMGEVSVIFNIQHQDDRWESYFWTSKEIIKLKEVYVPSLVFGNSDDSQEFWSIETQMHFFLLGKMLRCPNYVPLNQDTINEDMDYILDVMGELKMCPRERKVNMISTSDPKMFIDASGKAYYTENSRYLLERQIVEIAILGSILYYKRDVKGIPHTTLEIDHMNHNVVLSSDLNSLIEKHCPGSALRLDNLFWTVNKKEMNQKRNVGENVILFQPFLIAKNKCLIKYFEGHRYIRGDYYRLILETSSHRFSVQPYRNCHQVWKDAKGNLIYVSDHYIAGYRLLVYKDQYGVNRPKFTYFKIEKGRNRSSEVITKINLKRRRVEKNKDDNRLRERRKN